MNPLSLLEALSERRRATNLFDGFLIGAWSQAQPGATGQQQHPYRLVSHPDTTAHEQRTDVGDAVEFGVNC